MAREIEIIIYKIAPILPLDTSINILNPVIATGEFPSNICALKILTDLTDKQGKELTDNHLDIIMPNIARVSKYIKQESKKQIEILRFKRMLTFF